MPATVDLTAGPPFTRTRKSLPWRSHRSVVQLPLFGTLAIDRTRTSPRPSLAPSKVQIAVAKWRWPPSTSIFQLAGAVLSPFCVTLKVVWLFGSGVTLSQFTEISTAKSQAPGSRMSVSVTVTIEPFGNSGPRPKR